MLVVSGILCIYYNVIISWILYFLGMSFNSHLPWADCDNAWNTPACAKRVKDNMTIAFIYNESNPDAPYGVVTTMAPGPLNVSNITHKEVTPAEEFWQ